MSQAHILELVQHFSNHDADDVALIQYYAHAMDKLARHPYFVIASLVTITAGTGQYTLTADEQLRLVAAFYDDRLLDRVSLRDLEGVVGPLWRDRRGLPVAYTVENEAANTYRLYPVPDRPSGIPFFIYGAPFGLDFPAYAVVLFHTQRMTDLLPWMELPTVFDILDREYGHESNHRDDAMADFSKAMAQFLWQLVA